MKAEPMTRHTFGVVAGLSGALLAAGATQAAQPTQIQPSDRVYAAEQFSNTVSVTDPSTKIGRAHV